MKGGDGDLKGLETKLSLTFYEPREELLAILQEQQAIPRYRQCIRGFPIDPWV